MNLKKIPAAWTAGIRETNEKRCGEVCLPAEIVAKGPVIRVAGLLLLLFIGLLLRLVSCFGLLVLFIKGDGERFGLSAAQHSEGGGVSSLVIGGQRRSESRAGINGGIVNGDDDVARLEAGLLSTGAVGYALHIGAGADAVALSVFRDRGDLNAHIGLAGHIAVFDEVREDVFHVIDGSVDAMMASILLVSLFLKSLPRKLGLYPSA